MTSKLPYMASPGLAKKILQKIEEARRPDRFTQDYLETVLGFSGGSARAVIPLLKRMGYLGSDGTPTARYDQFRNPDTRGAAVADGIRQAYAELFDRNEYTNKLSREKLAALVIETTGASKDDRPAHLAVATFSSLAEMAAFEAKIPATDKPQKTDAEQPAIKVGFSPHPAVSATEDDVDFRISYTINLNLPETTNPEVFNAIFRSLKENLLRN